MELSLSILNIDYNQIEKNLKQYQKEINYLHLDIMDGHFVPNISFGPGLVKSIHRNNAFIYDTHLMISDPLKYIKEFVDAGSDLITFHFEAVDDVKKGIDMIHSYGIKAGISIKPDTKVEKLLPYLELIDLVLIMSVEPGFGGQSFMESSVEKAKLLKHWKEEKGYSYLISIDGGINDVTLLKVKPYIDLAVVGSYITSSSNPLEKIWKLKHIL